MSIELGSWTYGNRVRLLENGEEYYPAVFEAIASAQSEVLLETFLIFDDIVGRQLKNALICAAQRGARVVATADHYGTPDLPEAFVREMLDAGVDFRYFDPRPRLLGWRANFFRRLHRKIVVVDRRVGFIGGINYSLDHLREHGDQSKQDYAVEIQGPAVEQLREAVEHLLTARRLPRRRPWWRTRVRPPTDARPHREGVASLLIWRDNDHHQDDIEVQYRAAIHAAQHEVLIANAYFFPGYRLVREIRLAARRGVRVRLLLQGSADKMIVTWAARSLYRYLARAGVTIYEYCERPFHGKVAVIDERWATVGSSNLDPTSLSLNLEANLVLDDSAFARTLRLSLERLIENHCRHIGAGDAPDERWWQRIGGVFVFHLMRRFPGWARWLPHRRQPVVAAAEALPLTTAASADHPPG